MAIRYLAMGGVGLCLTTLAAGAQLRNESHGKPPALPSSSIAKLVSHLRNDAERSGTRTYLVQMRDRQEGLAALRSAGARVDHAYNALTLATVTADAGALTRLLASDQVTRVSADGAVK